MIKRKYTATRIPITATAQPAMIAIFFPSIEEIRGAVSATPLRWLSLSVNVGYNTYGMAYGFAMAVNTRPVRFFLGTDAYVFEMTPQLIPLYR